MLRIRVLFLRYVPGSIAATVFLIDPSIALDGVELCTPAVLESGGDQKLYQDKMFLFSTSGSRSRIHPLEGILCFDAKEYVWTSGSMGMGNGKGIGEIPFYDQRCCVADKTAMVRKPQ